MSVVPGTSQNRSTILVFAVLWLSRGNGWCANGFSPAAPLFFTCTVPTQSVSSATVSDGKKRQSDSARRHRWSKFHGISSSSANSITEQDQETAAIIPQERAVSSLDHAREVKLMAALSSGFNSTDARELLQEIQTIQRDESSGNSSQSLMMVQDVLQQLLDQGPDRALPFWCRSSWLTRSLASSSRRARWAMLRRVLDLTTPPAPSMDKESDQKDVNQQQRRRRALLSVLRSLSQPASESGITLNKERPSSSKPAIQWLERQAVRELRQTQKRTSTSDLIARRPVGLETPRYTVLPSAGGGSKKRYGDYEIRRYEPYTVATVTMEDLRQREADPNRFDAKVNEPAKGGVKAFGALAGYLFGKNEQKMPMKMTTPVFSTPSLSTSNSDTTPEEQGSSTSMSFVLPSMYWNDEASAAPQPLPGSGVQLRRVLPEERAVLSFGGFVRDNASREIRLLLEQLKNDPDWQVVDDIAYSREYNAPIVQLAQYNDPFTPPWKRLNEVSVRVRRREN